MIYIVEQKKNRKQEKYYTELLYKLFYLNLLFFKIKINNSEYYISYNFIN